MSSLTLISALSLLAVYGIRTLLRRVSSVLDNIPGPSRKSFLTGNLTQYYDPDDWAFHTELEENYGQVVKLHGPLGDRHLFVFDPEALTSILVKDQDLYEEMPQFMRYCVHSHCPPKPDDALPSMNTLILGKGILSTVGDDHRRYRKIMFPAFSATNLRGIVPLFYAVAEQARDGLIAPNVRDGPQMIDLNSIAGRTSLELLGAPGLAIHLMPCYPARSRPTVTHSLCGMRSCWGQKGRDSEREMYIENDAKDIMSLLIKSNMVADGGMYLTDEELIGATSTIISAATDTTSNALSRMFHTLALHPEMQAKLRAEILGAPEHLDYVALEALPYLDAFVREVLRLFPPVTPGMFRQTCENAVLPLSKPIIGVDGVPMKAIAVPKGTCIYIAITAANHNKQIWGADALEFKPERWANEKTESVTTKMCGIYGNTMTFLGAGGAASRDEWVSPSHTRRLFVWSNLFPSEAVACVMLRAFKFSNPDPRVKWRMTGIIPSPNVDNQSCLPILVERMLVVWARYQVSVAHFDRWEKENARE
ncbi:cytochrome P450 [Mycena rosella]|uniref:Cytochrome P450 n=1 Tax=Mycena rosella TaxID=1033263 RepID=A0AAD7D4I3_MYCRO|nr:cytochrome P450 [Mycena rosella]